MIRLTASPPQSTPNPLVVLCHRARVLVIGIAICLIATVIPNALNAAKIEWKTVPVDSLNTYFRGSALGLHLSQSKSAYTSNGIKFEFSSWAGNSRFGIIFSKLADPGRLFKAGKDWSNVETEVQTFFPYLKNKSLKWNRRESVGNSLGSFTMHLFNADTESCMAYKFDVGEGYNADGARGIVTFLYCQPENFNLEFAKQISLLTGHKTQYTPPKVPEMIVSESEKPVDETPIATKTTDEKGGDATKQNSLAEGWQSVPLAASWESKEDLLAGLLKYKNNAGKGLIEASAGNISCKGRWQFVSGKYGTSNPPIGTWAIACNDGSAASGTYKSDKLGRGIGRGTDANGKIVKLTFGLN